MQNSIYIEFYVGLYFDFRIESWVLVALSDTTYLCVKEDFCFLLTSSASSSLGDFDMVVIIFKTNHQS